MLIGRNDFPWPSIHGSSLTPRVIGDAELYNSAGRSVSSREGLTYTALLPLRGRFDLAWHGDLGHKGKWQMANGKWQILPLVSIDPGVVRFQVAESGINRNLLAMAAV